MSAPREIQSFLDSEGRLTRMPSKRRKKLIALSYIADRLPEDGIYSEKQFGELLCELHTFNDPATLRRELYDNYLIYRTPSGTEYSVNPERPTAEELISGCRI